MVSSPEYKPGAYIFFSNASEEYIGEVIGPTRMGGMYTGWVEVIFYYPRYFGSTVDPKNLRLATDAEVCLLRMEGYLMEPLSENFTILHPQPKREK